MKRQYESMESFKVNFNADEQVSAACSIYMGSNKMMDNGASLCLLNSSANKYQKNTGADDRCKVSENDINRYAV